MNSKNCLELLIWGHESSSRKLPSGVCGLPNFLPLPVSLLMGLRQNLYHAAHLLSPINWGLLRVRHVLLQSDSYMLDAASATK